MTRHTTTERAQGRWPDILSCFGIDGPYLRNRHGPCPLCGGRDRFRFDDKGGSGSHYCNQCGAGGGINLLMKFKGWDFRTACQEVDQLLRDYRPSPTPAKQRPTDERRRGDVDRLLRGATQPEIVQRYLQNRGLSVRSPVLRGHPRCAYRNEDGDLVGHYAAVIAPIRNQAGEVRSALRIYMADLEPRKKAMPPVGTIRGCAIRLFDATDELGISEGVETALAVRELFGIPCWAGISDHILAAFEPPPGLKRLVIFGDNDRNGAGQRATYKLASRMAGKIGVEIKIPPEADTDWLDVLNAGAA